MRWPTEPDSADRPPLALLMREAPVVADPKAAKIKLSHAIERLAPEACAALDALFTAAPCAEQVCLGIAESSPFLIEVVRSEPERLLRVLDRPPHAHLDALIAECAAADGSEADVMRTLRRMRSEAALLIAVADMGGVFGLSGSHRRTDGRGRRGCAQGAVLPPRTRR